MGLFGLKQKIKIKKLRKKGVKIGTNSLILNKISYFSSEPYLICIGDDCLISANVLFTPHDGGTWTINKLYGTDYDKIGKIDIGNKVYIGFGSIIFGNVKIGDNSIIGANSIVTKDIPSGSVACGAPARVICSIDDYITKNKGKFTSTFYLNKKDKKNFFLEKDK